MTFTLKNILGGAGILINDTNPVSPSISEKGAIEINSAPEPTINTDLYKDVSILALSTSITSMTTNLTGTPVNFQKLLFRIKDDGVSRTIAWGASFAERGASLVTATVPGKVHTILFIYNSVTATWDCISTSVES